MKTPQTILYLNVFFCLLILALLVIPIPDHFFRSHPQPIQRQDIPLSLSPMPILTSIALPTSPPTPTLAPPSPNELGDKSYVVSIDDKWNKYINAAFGFTITYPQIASNATGCNITGNLLGNGRLYSPAYIKLFEHEDNYSGVIFLSFPTFTIIASKLAPQGNLIPSSCTIKTTTLDILEHGYFTGGYDNHQDYPINIFYRFAHISSDDELKIFVQKTLGKGCVKLIKHPSEYPGIYTISAADKNGNPGAGFSDTCSQTGPDSYYSPDNKLAILGNPYQNCLWGLIDNYHCNVKVEFLKTH